MLNAEETVTLEGAGSGGALQVPVMRDLKGDSFLPLADLARFYGIRVDFDAQDRRVTLEKGKIRVKFVLSQPLFMIQESGASYPMDPAEEVAGRLGVPAGSAQDLLSAVLDRDVRYLSDRRELVAGDAVEADARVPVPAPSPEPVAAAVKAAPPQPTATPAPEAAEAQVENAQGDMSVDSDQAEKLPPPGEAEEEAPSPDQIYQVRRIIIDPGHGGVDSGAKGYDHHYMEKQATLDIAERLVDILKKHTGLQVLITRKADYYITLKYRTEFANRHDGDLFVSIHCNSNPNHRASGTEVFVYGARASNRLAAVAAYRENEGVDYTNFILSDLHHYKKYSLKVAELVSRSIRRMLGQYIRPVQHANFYVLARVDMPSILVETAFISNRKEEKKLENSAWREKIAQAIADGILNYRRIVEGENENEEARR